MEQMGDACCVLPSGKLRRSNLLFPSFVKGPLTGFRDWYKLYLAIEGDTIFAST